MSEAPIRPARRTIEKMIATLEALDSNLMCEICDEQAYAEWQVEEQGLTYDDFTEDEDGNEVGIVYPENAAPDLDGARTAVSEAVDFLREYLEGREAEGDFSV